MRWVYLGSHSKHDARPVLAAYVPAALSNFVMKISIIMSSVRKIHFRIQIAQQSKEEKKEAKKLKRYKEIYNKEGAYMADLFENHGARYRCERSKQKKNKKTYLTDKQVEDQTKPYNTRRNNKK